jgi:excinuclease ABC subunit A
MTHDRRTYHTETHLSRFYVKKCTANTQLARRRPIGQSHGMSENASYIEITGACENNLKNINLRIPRRAITVVTGVSGSGKSSLAFDTILAESRRRFLSTLSQYSRQFLDMGRKPKVEKLRHLSPAIALAQNETTPSVKSTVGTLSDVAELLGVCFARFAKAHCPTHHLPTTSQSIDDITASIMNQYLGSTIVLCHPLAEKNKGIFQKEMNRFSTLGFNKAFIDGKVVDIDPVPELNKEQKHTIKIFIDVLNVKPETKHRLSRSLQATLEYGSSGEYFVFDPDEMNLSLKHGSSFSLKAGCPECGYSWPSLDTRYFSINSLGQCEKCEGFGELDLEEHDEEPLSYLSSKVCLSCDGTGLHPKLKSLKLGDLDPLTCQSMTLSLLNDALGKTKIQNDAMQYVLEQTQEKLKHIIRSGLGYLQLKRRIRSLSPGELQRLKLSGILSSKLTGVLYVLDEPSQGLADEEILDLCQNLKELKKLGNTILIVDHDETLMRESDFILDIGPGGGRDGGEVMAFFEPHNAKEHVEGSRTAAHLAKHLQPQSVPTSIIQSKHEFISILKPRKHFLKMDQVRFLKHQLNVVTGRSGSGKNTLVFQTLFHNLYERIQGSKHWHACEQIQGIDDIEQIEWIDRRKVAKSHISMPATYLDIFKDIRELYAKLPDAQIQGITSASLSLARAGGRCEECQGRGQIKLQMRFLQDAFIPCHVCDGDRYRPHIRQLRYRSLSIPDLLALSLTEVIEHFKTHKMIKRKLQPAIDLGLGYLRLGQPTSSLSGGEAQRLKLSPYLAKTTGEKSCVFLDEPTTGLHVEDILKLKKSLESLVEKGTTLIMSEHSQHFTKDAQWLIRLGPGAAEQGGELLYEGHGYHEVQAKDTKKTSRKAPKGSKLLGME